jgi:hypothetical protein
VKYGQFSHEVEITPNVELVFDSKSGDIRQISVWSDFYDDVLYWIHTDFIEEVLKDGNRAIDWHDIIPTLDRALQMVQQRRDGKDVDVGLLNYVTFDLEDDERERLEIAAAHHDVTIDELVNLALRDYITNIPNDTKTS